MIETEPQTKKTFVREVKDYINQLQNEVSELDANLPNFAQHLDCMISTNRSLRYSAINSNANFYIPNSSFNQITDHFERSINILRDRPSDINWITKGLLLEAVNMMSQIINEYCDEKERDVDWAELQNNLFEQFNEHLMLNVDEFAALRAKINEPFNLKDTQEALHLFDTDFETGFHHKLSLTEENQFNNSEGFLMIQLDDEAASDKVKLPMPELLADIFLVSSVEQPLADDTKTEVLAVNREDGKDKVAVFEDDFDDEAWTKFSSPESWSGMDDNEISTLEELEANFNLSTDNNISTSHDFFEHLEDNENIFEDNVRGDSLKSIQDSQLDKSSVEQPINANQFGVNQLSRDSDSRRLEIFQDQNFSTSDVDTAIEESPIYQNNPKCSPPFSPSYEQNLSLTNFDNKDISCADKNLETTLLSTTSSLNSSPIRIPFNHVEMLGDLSEALLVRKGLLDVYLGEMRIVLSEAQTDLQASNLQASNLEISDSNSVRQKQPAIADLNNVFERLVNIIDRAEHQTYTMSQETRHLRQNLRQALKYPISSLVRQFPRILHDLSLQSGKQVELIVQGAEVGIERVISELIADPIELLLRNAFEYGIEFPTERQQQGKGLQGKIEVSASQTDEITMIKISDDGRGLENNIRLGDLKEKLSEIGGSITVQSKLGEGTEFTMIVPNTLSLMRVLLIDIDQICLAIPSKVIQEVIPIDDYDNLPDKYLSNQNIETFIWRDRVIPIIQLHPLLKLNCRHNLNQDSQTTNQSLQLHGYAERRKPNNAVPSFVVIDYENDLFALQTDGCWNDQEATFHQIEGDILLPQIFLGTVILGSDQAVALINPSELVSQCLRSQPNNPVPISQSPPRNHTNQADLNDLNSLSDFFGACDLSQDSNLLNSPDPSVRVLDQSPEPENLESSGLFVSEIDYGQTMRSHQPKVLIVESSANISRYLAMTLAKSGFLTEQVHNGKEAIDLLQERLKIGLDIDIVITDLKTPQMDGFKLLSGIRSDKDIHSLPVVVLTSRNNENDHKLALELGANGYFSKPYREQELVATLQQIISGSQKTDDA